MVHYGGLTTLESVIMGTVVILGNFAGFPSIYSLMKRKGLEFEAIIAIFVFVSSVMYHMCEVLDCDLYMNEDEWHRLDNVFVICALGIYILHLSGNGHCRKTIYFTLVVSLLTQQKDPWNIYYTFLPLTLFEVQAIVLRIYYWKKVEVKYNFNRLFASIGILLMAGQFFINGLVEKNDYLRLNHGLWHMFVGIAHYYGINCTSWKDAEDTPGYEHVVEEEVDATQ